MRIEQFSPEIKYIPGKTNGIADLLSRSLMMMTVDTLLSPMVDSSSMSTEEDDVSTENSPSTKNHPQVDHAILGQVHGNWQGHHWSGGDSSQTETQWHRAHLEEGNILVCSKHPCMFEDQTWTRELCSFNFVHKIV